MRTSWLLARVRGIEIRVHVTFVLLLAAYAGRAWFDTRRLDDAVDAIVVVGTVFGCVVLHELGHATAARRYGVRTRDITLLPIGGVARLDGEPPTPGAEIVVALAGPAVNVAIALLLWLLGAGSAGPDDPDAAASIPDALYAINLSLAAFNLLPAFPMDGGRVLRAALAMRMAPERATRISARIGQAIAVAFILAGVFFNPMLALIGAFVWFGAATEIAATDPRQRSRT
ncbi:MAG TPA: site-2 protease family protein [Burkholderiaceae bacterium]|nr:site-2 protease family protein [Burkholderiaceae bacterium]